MFVGPPAGLEPLKVAGLVFGSPCRESAVFGRVLGLVLRGGAACGWIVGSSDDRGQKHTRGGKKDQTGPAVCAVLAWVLCHNGLAISVGPHITIVASRAAAQRGFLDGCDTVTNRSCSSRAQNGREPPCRHYCGRAILIRGDAGPGIAESNRFAAHEAWVMSFRRPSDPGQFE